LEKLLPILIKQNEDQAVSARDVHNYLKVGRDFTTWIKGRIEQYGFIEEVDYLLLTNLGEQKGRGGSNKVDYILTLDTAKELCMVENNEKGKEARDYFIEAEKRYIKMMMERHTSDWMIARVNGKLVRRAETDAIQKLIPMAEEQGSKNANKLYMTYSKLTNKTVGVESGKRDTATYTQLRNISTIEDIISRTIEQEVANGTYYKEIYKKCKAKTEQFAQLAGLLEEVA
jgi:phage anti-repressor protein